MESAPAVSHARLVFRDSAGRAQRMRMRILMPGFVGSAASVRSVVGEVVGVGGVGDGNIGAVKTVSIFR